MYAPLNGGEYSWSVQETQTVTESGSIIRNRYERNTRLAILGCTDRLVMYRQIWGSLISRSTM